jgi:peptide/nickel transport system substrate-binding protein
MNEHDLRGLVDEVKAGRLSRRCFVQALVGLGLTAPIAAHLLAWAGLAAAQPSTPVFVPARRGGGGALKLLWWQAPTLLNPHFGTGTKDLDGSRIFYEPLAAYDPDGALVPVLAAEIPSVQSGTLDRDGLWVIWRLKKGVAWHDGRPFTAADVVFNWEYVADPATGTVNLGAYQPIQRVDRLDDHAVKVVFSRPTPFWFDAFCGNRTIIPKHLFEVYRGARSREAPANIKPVGTGPYRFVDFKPGDLVRAELFPHYHVSTGRFFDTLEMKGGGDAASAARAVLQTGEYDYAWNMLVEDDLLRRLEHGGKGRIEIFPTGSVEHIQCNFTDPGKEVDGERSSIKTAHPTLSDPAVRQALNVLIDRAAVQEQIYGRQGQATPNFLNAPSRYHSRNTRWEFNVERANQLLEGAGWKRGPDGIRVEDGKRLRLVYQTSINAPRQKTQAIVKQACARAGIEVELKAVVASAFFSSDPANPDTYSHFYADLQMYNTGPGAPDPERLMWQFTTDQVASKENKWSGRNITRFRNEEYDRLWKAAEQEMDPVKRAAQFIQMNDMVIQHVAVIPVLWRSGVGAATARLRGMELSGWDSTLWRLAYWHKT